MATIIVAFPKLEEARAIRNLLIRKGFDVAMPLTSGAQVINQADSLASGIIVCGYKLSDNMVYTDLNEYKPKSFEILLVTSQNRWEECRDNNIVCLGTPLKANELVSTLEMMIQSQIRTRKKKRSTPTKRSPEEQRIIDDAKHLLMERNNMSEPEAFRYIQKCSMDSGNSMVESARMVIGLYEE